VQVAGLAVDLRVEVETRTGMRGRARWQRVRIRDPLRDATLWATAPVQRDVIHLRDGLRASTRRFALAHELGHVIMHRYHQPLAGALSVAGHERFANVFAAELLVSRSHREELIGRFRGTLDPVGLLQLADSLGISPQTLLRFARRENWLEGLDHGWVDIRVLANRYTGADCRPRVYDATFDRSRWFLPRNRSVTGAFGTDSWLANADLEVTESEQTVKISRCREHVVPRFVQALVRARLLAVRLYRTSAPYGMEYLASAELLEDQPSQDADSEHLQTVLF